MTTVVKTPHTLILTPDDGPTLKLEVEGFRATGYVRSKKGQWREVFSLRDTDLVAMMVFCLTHKTLETYTGPDNCVTLTDVAKVAKNMVKFDKRPADQFLIP